MAMITAKPAPACVSVPNRGERASSPRNERNSAVHPIVAHPIKTHGKHSAPHVASGAIHISVTAVMITPVHTLATQSTAIHFHNTAGTCAMMACLACKPTNKPIHANPSCNNGRSSVSDSLVRK